MLLDLLELLESLLELLLALVMDQHCSFFTFKYLEEESSLALDNFPHLEVVVVPVVDEFGVVDAGLLM